MVLPTFGWYPTGKVWVIGVLPLSRHSVTFCFLNSLENMLFKNTKSYQNFSKRYFIDQLSSRELDEHWSLHLSTTTANSRVLVGSLLCSIGVPTPFPNYAGKSDDKINQIIIIYLTTKYIYSPLTHL